MTDTKTATAKTKAADQKEVTKTPAQPKEKSEGSDATDRFQTRLANRMSGVLGKQISKQIAWKLFKAAIHAAFGHVIEEPQGKQFLSLSGIGRFEVIEAKNRPAGETSNEDSKKYAERAAKLGFNPRVRLYPSTAIQHRADAAFGLVDLKEDENPTPVEDRPWVPKVPDATPAATSAKPKTTSTAAPATDISADIDAIDTSDLDLVDTLDVADGPTAAADDEITIDESEL